MSDYEESPYEDDEPRQATNVEILPPPKKQRSWLDVGLYAFAIIVAGKVGYHAIDRLSPAPAATQRASMISESLPVSDNVEDRREAAPPAHPRWSYGIKPSAEAPYPRQAHHRSYRVRVVEEPSWPGHDGSEIDEDEEREAELEDARRVGREAAIRDAQRPSRGLWPLIEEFDPGAQARHERYMSYTREMQRLRSGTD